MRKSFFFGLALILGIISCDSAIKFNNNWRPYYQAENASIFDERIKLESIDTIKFGLNNQIGFESNSINYFELNLNAFYSMTSNFNSSILIYEYNNPALIQHSIHLNTNENNNVGALSNGHGHIVLNKDSIYLYNPNTANLYLLDFDGVVKSKIQFLELTASTPHFGRPRIQNIAPMQRLGEYLYIPCSVNAHLEDYSDHHMILKYHLPSNTFEFIGRASPLYSKAFWGSLFNYKSIISIHPTSHELIVGFPIDPFLYILTTEGNVISNHFVGSSVFKEISPMNYDLNFNKKNDPYTGKELRSSYGLTNSNFPGLLSDPYHQLLYRIAYVKPTLDQYQKGSKIPDLQIIILDTTFQKVGELNLSGKKYKVSMLFVSPRGLHIARNDLYQQNNHELSFEIFRPQLNHHE